MIEINFSLNNCGDQQTAYLMWKNAMTLLHNHQIPFSNSVDEILYNGPDFRLCSPRTFYTVYKIFLQDDSNYSAYLLIED